jgi:hypothetical protein
MEAQGSRFRVHSGLAKERSDIRFLFAMDSLYRSFVFVKFKFVRIQDIWQNA